MSDPMSDPTSDPATMSGSQPKNYKIICLLKVTDDPPVLEIKIASNESVAALKKAIKTETPTTLSSIEAIHSSYIASIETLEKAEDLSQLKELENPIAKLGKVFSNSTLLEDTIHILVLPPTSGRTPPNRPSPLPSLNESPQSGPRRDINTVQNSIDEFIATELRPKIEEFFRSPRLPHWSPAGLASEETQKFYQELAIPLVWGEPSLLFQNLRENPNPNGDRLFEKRHKILCNTSGSGKTRLLLEGLCRKWGFYFVAARGPDAIGSQDLQAMVESMPDSLGWIRDIFTTSDCEKVASANNSNQTIAFNRISRVLIARWKIFNVFIDVAKSCHGGRLPDEIKYDWLLFQALPPVLTIATKEMDVFLAFIDTCLFNVGDGVLEVLDKATVRDVPGSDQFFYVLDEVQVAGRIHKVCFSDADGKLRRPVLRPIIRKMTQNSPFPVIVSGTGFSLEHFKDVLTSGVGKHSSQTWTVQHTTGDFTLQEVQSSYISRYLPSSFLNSLSGTLLGDRMFKWLRGRHRFTARFLEELLKGSWKADGPSSPHKMLNVYVKALSEFYPLDASSTVLDLEPSVASPKIDSFEWEKIEHEAGLLDVLAKSIYDFLTRGSYPMWYYDKQTLVEYGLARFPEEGKVEIVEPLAIISIIRYFESKGRTITRNILQSLQDNKGTAFEEAVLWAMTRLLRGQYRLTDILEFKGPAPDWASCTAQIVARSSNQFVDFDIITQQLDWSGNSIAIRAITVDQVTSWLKTGEAGWCLPGPLMGPDLMARVRLDNGKIILLVIQAKCHMAGNVQTTAAQVSTSAIESLISKTWYHSIVKGNRGTRQRAQHKINSMLDAIDTENQSPASAGQRPILRIVASFPLVVDLNSRAKSVRAALDKDSHPLALLSTSALTSVLATVPEGFSIVRQLTENLKRMRESDKDDTGEPPAKKRR
ncbi:hypothetical protein CPB86DRAFT_874942 [Serendipita vermifera]|nr:hypothetical protein CPB86DRAFT_874942 [Serendipita vermifera]